MPSEPNSCQDSMTASMARFAKAGANDKVKFIFGSSCGQTRLVLLSLYSGSNRWACLKSRASGFQRERLMRTALLTAVFTVALVGAGGRAGEEKVPLDKLPKAVADAVKKRFP